MSFSKVKDTIKQLQFRQVIQEFNSELQKGDLGLSQIVDYAFVLYGYTKIGKTTTGHIMSGNPVKGQKLNGQHIVNATTSRNKKAKIGNKTSSQTTIPNFFDVKIKDSKYTGKVCLIDTPGYGDTYGVLRILSNGYFHYRLYSKVKNMKFILCFDVSFINDTAAKFIDTIMQFASSFKDYLDKKEQIWKSCAFLFTKVEQTFQDIINRLQYIVQDTKTQYTPQEEKALKEFIEFMIKQKRIVVISKIKSGESAKETNLLDKVDQMVPKWWERKFDSLKNTVDMSPITFSLSKNIILETTKSPMSQKMFCQLIQYYNIRIKQFFQRVTESLRDENNHYSLGYVLNELVNDAMGHPDSHKFFDVMQSYVNLYYNRFDPQYRDDRSNKQKLMFSLPIDSQDSLRQKARYNAKDKNYLVKKFKVLKQIQQLKNQSNSIQFQERNLDWLQKCEQNLYGIIRQMNRICFKRTKSVQIIYKYGYLIYRIVQVAKLFLLLIEMSGSQQHIQRIRQCSNQQFIQLMRLLKDFMGDPYNYNDVEYNYKDLHLQFVKKFNLDDQIYKKLTINGPFIQFFTQKKTEDHMQSQKFVKIVLKYSDQILNQCEDNHKEISVKDQNKLIRRLTSARLNCEASFQHKETQYEKNCITFLIRKTTKNLGRVLEHMKKYHLARQVYDSIKFVNCVCRLFNQQLEQHKKNFKTQEFDHYEYFRLRMKYSEYLKQHFRQNQAIQVLQETFQLANDINELREVKQELSELKLKIINGQNGRKYAESLLNQEYFEYFNDGLEKQILNLCDDQ